MILPEELQKTAQSLGEALKANEAVQAYLKAKADLEKDAEGSTLETRLFTLYESLIARQQVGETLERQELDEFYSLRNLVRTHPLVTERDAALTQAKLFLADIANEISNALGVDYTALAQS